MAAWNIRFWISTTNVVPRCKKARPWERPGSSIYDLRRSSVRFGFGHQQPERCLHIEGNQPRVRERIMKLSKVYSATCHHKYSSERYACIASIDFLKSGFF